MCLLPGALLLRLPLLLNLLLRLLSARLRLLSTGCLLLLPGLLLLLNLPLRLLRAGLRLLNARLRLLSAVLLLLLPGLLRLPFGSLLPGLLWYGLCPAWWRCLSAPFSLWRFILLALRFGLLFTLPFMLPIHPYRAAKER